MDFSVGCLFGSGLMFALGIARSGFQRLAIFVVFEALVIGMLLRPVFLGPTTISVTRTASGHATTRELFPQHHTSIEALTLGAVAGITLIAGAIATGLKRLVTTASPEARLAGD